MSRLVAAALFLGSALAHGAGPVPGPHTTVELVSERPSVAPGSRASVGILFRNDPGWHIYWINAGDSGLPPRAKWRLPEGASAGPLLFPVPEVLPGKLLVNYGYHGETLLIADVAFPADLRGPAVKLAAKVDYLICEDECVPGKADVELELPVGAGDGAADPAFGRTRARHPVPLPEGRSVAARYAADSVTLTLSRTPKADPAFFFPYEDVPTKNTREPKVRWRKGGLELTLPWDGERSGRVAAGVIRLGDAAYEIAAPIQGAPPAPPRAAAPAASETPASTDDAAPVSLALALLLAFLGGLILNLMPCILPVLSIKVLGFVEHAADAKEARKQGWAFTLGVLASFWAFAAAVAVIKAGGAGVGWGFQLQSPAFVAALGVLFALMGLNLLGVFEVGESWTGAGSRLSARTGLAGSFFTGVVTVVAASPCSAPFMGTALGYALAQSAWVSALVLTALGAGLAFPYLLFTYSPALLRRLPRPGQWMVRFKQALAFPLFATVIWLLAVLGAQAGLDGVVRALIALLVAGFAGWVYGGFKGPASRAVAVAALIGAGALCWGVRAQPKGAQAAAAHGGWGAFSESALEAARAAGKPVFLDFTADWCVTCKVNERLVLDTSEVQAAFTQGGVVLLRGDWTSADPAITAFLARHGRNSVPVYLWYAPGASKPEMLPQVLTSGMILQRLNSLRR